MALQEPPTPAGDEVTFIDRVLEGWARWTHDDGIDLRPTCAGDLWKVAAIIEVTDGILRMTEERFVLVDQKIAKLPDRLRTVVFVEYRNGGTQEAKARFMGLNRAAYRARIQAAQWALYALLSPDIENWRDSSHARA